MPFILAGIAALLAIGYAAFRTLRPRFMGVPQISSVNTIHDFEKYAQQLVAYGEPPALSVVVVKNDNIVYHKGFGVIDAYGTPPTNQTVYHIWSITKLFTVLATLKLAEQGKLGLDDTVQQHLPFFDVEYPSEDSTPITLRHLLTHSSGLADAGNEILTWIRFDEDRPVNQTDFVRQKFPQFRQLVYAPGTQGQYTNFGYMVLSAVIEAASGQSYESYVVEHIARPLSMTSTDFVYRPTMEDHEAWGTHPIDIMAIMARFMVNMRRLTRTRRGGRYWFDRVYTLQTAPSGLLTSTEDMATFMRMLLNQGRLDGVQLLTPDQIALMNAPQITATKHQAAGIDHLEFAFGWHRFEDDKKRKVLAHGGNGMGFAGMISLYPDENLGIFVVGNSTYLGKDFGLSLVDALANIH